MTVEESGNIGYLGPNEEINGSSIAKNMPKLKPLALMCYYCYRMVS